MGSPKPLIGNQVKHLLIILTFLLLSSPLFGQETGILYQWESSYGYVWKTFGDEQTNPKYRGEIKNGKPEGFGILIWFDGKKYVGMWKNGKMNGQGTRTLGHFWDRPDIKPFQTEKGIFKDDKSWNTTIVDKKHKIFGKFVNGKWIRP